MQLILGQPENAATTSKKTHWHYSSRVTEPRQMEKGKGYEVSLYCVIEKQRVGDLGRRQNRQKGDCRLFFRKGVCAWGKAGAPSVSEWVNTRRFRMEKKNKKGCKKTSASRRKKAVRLLLIHLK